MNSTELYPVAEGGFVLVRSECGVEVVLTPVREPYTVEYKAECAK